MQLQKKKRKRERRSKKYQEGTGPQWCDFRKDGIKISGNSRHNFKIAQGDGSGIIHLLKPYIYITPEYQTSQFLGDAFWLLFYILNSYIIGYMKKHP